MARVTVEDCIEKVPNRFELVMLSAQRSRNIVAGASLTLERDRDKNPVVALREIAEGTLSFDDLHNDLLRGLQKHVDMDEPEDEEGLKEQLALRQTDGNLEIGADSVGEEGLPADMESTAKTASADEEQELPADVRFEDVILTKGE